MKLKILVADDSISIQKLVAMAFYNEDMEVEGISEGVKAFHYLSEFHPDLVMEGLVTRTSSTPTAARRIFYTFICPTRLWTACSPR